MPLDLFAFTVAATFVAGCASIHAFRRHADAVIFILLAYGLATVLGSMLAARNGMATAPDPSGG
jgi:hypothetical protein